MIESVEKAFVEITGSEPHFHRKGCGPKRVLIMSGLPFSGKSHLSNLILEKSAKPVTLVRSDSIRPAITRAMGNDEPTYHQDEHENVFLLGHELVKKSLELGHPTIADATNLTEKFRKWATKAASKTDSEILVAFINVSDEIAMNRAASGPQNQSAASPAVYAILKYEKEPVEKCKAPYIIVDAEGDVNPTAEMLAKWLSGEINEVPGTFSKI